MTFLHIRLRTGLVFLVFLLAAATCAGIPVFAQLTVEIAPVSGGVSVETAAYPLLTARIRAERGGTPITLISANIYIIEGNYSTQPFKIDPPSNRFQRIYWHSRSQGVRVVSPQLPLPNDVQFVVSEGNEVGSALAKHTLQDDVQVRFRDFLANNVQSLVFSNVSAGKDSTMSVNLSAIRTRVDANQRSESVRIDSISTRTPYFRWEWKGTPIVSSRAPPTYIQSPFRYRIDVTFKPPSEGYFYDVLTVHYEGGAKETLELFGNRFNLPQNTILNLTQPNARQSFSPCQIVDIRWKGSVAGAKNIVEYSNNAGKTWLAAGETLDSSFLWKVPSTYTDSLALRVRQDFTNFAEYTLRDEPAGAYALAYNRDGSAFAVGFENGSVIEYSSQTRTSIAKHSIGNVGFPVQKAVCFGVAYLGGNRLVAGFRRADGSQELDFFLGAAQAPSAVVSIQSAVKFQRLLIDPSETTIVCVPEFGNRLYIYSTADGSVVRTVDYSTPISAFTMNNDGRGAIALLDGTVGLVAAPDFSLAAPVKFPELPIINGIALSPNNNMLGVATMASIATVSSGNQSAVHIVDIASKTIIRTLRKSSSDALNLAFNGTSRYLGLGYAFQPQVSLWQIVDDDFNGGLSGHTGRMTSISYSPDGRVIATTGLSSDNVVLRNFSYPESDMADELMRIVPANISITAAALRPNFLMNKRDTTLTSSLCNLSSSVMLFDNAAFVSGRHFSFARPITALDSLFPGKCLEIQLTFQPKDTGWVRDTMIFTSCSRQFAVPVEAYSHSRNIEFLANGFDFGESCVGDSLVREVVLLRNADPVPLEIDQISVENGFTSGFSFTPPVPKTVLQPGETLKAVVRFYPKSVGADITNILVLHSGQLQFIPSFTLQGRGIGANVAMASDLRFIPEIGTRTITLKNNSPNPVVLQSVTTSPPGTLTVSPPPPLDIPADGSITLNVSPTAPLSEFGVALEAEFNPCVVKKIFVAGAYSGTSSISAPVIEADPRGEVSIPVNFTNTENKPYNGVRFFEGEFTLNPRLFLPLRAESAFGTATITRNEVIDGIRVVGFRAEGDFPTNGVAVTVIGLAGLAETDRTPIEFLPTAAYWGAAVKTSTSSGELRILNTCAGCRIIHFKTLAIMAVAPNPAAAETSVAFYAPDSGEFTAQILNEVGLPVTQPVRISVREGTNVVTLTLDTLSNGAYRVVVSGTAGAASAPLMIVR